MQPKIFRILSIYNKLCVRNQLSHHAKILLFNYRNYEGKPFDQRNKNWPEEQDKNREYDIDQNIHNFRRKEELKMNEKYHQNRQSNAYEKYKRKVSNEYQINEQWRQQREQQRAKDYNVSNFTFTEMPNVNQNTTNSTDNTMKYAMIGAAVIGIGCILLAVK
eukprot:293008_1